jgi:subtilisin family serine protease
MPRFSCRGPEVDLVAPGVKVCSIAPGLPGGRVLYDHCTGTSEAAAFVTGAAARLLAEHPELLEDRSRGRAETVRAALRERARPLGFGTHREGAGLVRIDTLGGPFRGG